ncbi:MAG TPA: pentapeptide repeat-containing protein [Pseudonocardia sp.]
MSGPARGAPRGQLAEGVGVEHLNTHQFTLGADLRGADLDRADLLGTDLRAADLRGARLAGSIFLTRPQIDAARGDSATTIPAALARPRHWP